MSTPSHRIFYAWQSELPNGTNRGLIERALTEAVKSLKDGVVDPAMDRDTLGIPGTPDIAQTIFDKIDACEVFVADISLVPRGSDDDAFRPTPNPNVLIELGYAAKSLGWDRVILVFNGAYGEIEDLPFDIRARRIARYDAKEGQQNGEARKKLASLFTSALEGMLREPPRRTPREPRIRLEWVVDPQSDRYGLHHKPQPATLRDGVLVLPAAMVQKPADLLNLGFGRLTLGRSMLPYNQAQEVIARHIRSMTQEVLVPWYGKQMLPSEGRTSRIRVLNDGGQPATEIKVELTLGTRFQACYPGVPRDPPRLGYDLVYSDPDLDRPQMHAVGPRMFSSEARADCQIDDSSIRVTTSKTLLHHHTTTASDPFVLGALPGTPPGVYDLEYSVFARELPAKARGVLRIEVTAPAREDAK